MTVHKQRRLAEIGLDLHYPALGRPQGVVFAAVAIVGGLAAFREPAAQTRPCLRRAAAMPSVGATGFTDLRPPA
jgi:TRAP-type C4-dicarboxylate transport system permease small subunit